MRPVDTIILHHSASPSETTTRADIHRWHTAPKPEGQGWSDIGYHKLVFPDGEIKQGRPDAVVGAHALDHNTGSFGILAMGDYEHEYPTMALIEGVIYACTVLCERHGIDPDNIKGHKDVNATKCPGRNLYPFIPYIIERVKKALAQRKRK